MSNAYVDLWDMLNNFFFICKLNCECCNNVTCHILHVTYHISHVTCLMSKAYFDSWHMLNNFGFHVWAQKWVWEPGMSECSCWTTLVFMCKLKSDCLSCWLLSIDMKTEVVHHSPYILVLVLVLFKSNVVECSWKLPCFFTILLLIFTRACDIWVHWAGSQLKINLRTPFIHL